MRHTTTRLVSLVLAGLLAGGGTLAAAPAGEGPAGHLPPPFDPETIRVAPPERLEGHDFGFERGRGESLEQVLVAEEESGARLSYTLGGKTLLSSSYRYDPSGGLAADLRVGDDRLEIVALAGADGSPERLLLSVNGSRGELWPAELGVLADGIAVGGPPVDSPLRQPLGDGFRDPAGFDLALAGYGDFLGRLQQLAFKGDLPVPSPHASVCCLWKCFVCGAAVFAYVLQVGDLVVNCGPGVVVTLGSLCFRNILTHMSVAGMMTGSCARCLKCIDECLTPMPVSGGGSRRW